MIGALIPVGFVEEMLKIWRRVVLGSDLRRNLADDAWYDDYYGYDGGSENEYEDEELPPKKELGYLEFIQKTKESVSLLPSLNS
ncbi:hypothetical protein Bca4012_083934 [Brassica carinata]